MCQVPGQAAVRSKASKRRCRHSDQILDWPAFCALQLHQYTWGHRSLSHKPSSRLHLEVFFPQCHLEQCPSPASGPESQEAGTGKLKSQTLGLPPFK